MSKRQVILTTNEFYHIFNRSVGHEEILTSQRNLHRVKELTDYYRFPQTLRFSQFKLLSQENQKSYLTKMNTQPQLVKILAFAFMSNHYRFLLQQFQDRGITTFIANLQNSFAKYFNLKNNRHGALFQCPFKAKRVTTDEELVHISRYIHLNPVTSFIIRFEDLVNYPWTSFVAYMQNSASSFLEKDKILNMFSSKNQYHKFTADQEGYQKQLSNIKYLILDYNPDV